MVSDVAYKTGTMVKDPRDMTDTQRTVWQKQCATDARDYLFSIGQPLVYRDGNGQLVAEYADGRIERAYSFPRTCPSSTRI